MFQLPFFVQYPISLQANALCKGRAHIWGFILSVQDNPRAQTNEAHTGIREARLYHSPGCKPTARAAVAVPKREKSELARAPPSTSGACRIMTLLCWNIRNPKERTTTPRKLSRRSPPPIASSPCTRQTLLSEGDPFHKADCACWAILFLI